MKDLGIVRGSKEQAVPLIVGVDTVYVHSDIREVEDGQFEYREVQYTLQEYTKLLADALHLEGIAVAGLKISDMQKNMLIENLGKALAQARLDIMQLKAKS